MQCFGGQRFSALLFPTHTTHHTPHPTCQPTNQPPRLPFMQDIHSIGVFLGTLKGLQLSFTMTLYSSAPFSKRFPSWACGISKFMRDRCAPGQNRLSAPQPPPPPTTTIIQSGELRFNRRGASTPLWGVESCSSPTKWPNPIPATPLCVVRTPHLHGAPTTEETFRVKL